MKQSEINTASHWISLLKRETDCPICLHTLVNPVTTSCYHTFCRTCISRVLNDSRSVCPLCKNKITRRGTTDNARVKSLVQRVDAVVNAFKNESGVDVKCHRGDTATPLKIRKYEEKEKERKGQEISPIGGECAPSDEITPSAVRLGNESQLNKGRTIIEDSDLASALLSESCNDIDHMSISQNVQADKPSTRRKSCGGLSMSLMKNKPQLPAHTPKSPVKKVKEWLGMGEGVSHLPDPSNDAAKTPLNGDLVTTHPDDRLSSSNWDGNGSDKGSRGKQFGKRVYGNSRMSGDLFTYPSKERRSRKPIIISDDDDDDGVNEIPTSDAGEMIPDSCPVETNDTFDKLLCGLKQKTGNKKDHTSKSPTPKIPIQVPDRNDITLFESLPLPADKESGRKKNNSFSMKEEEEISRKCGLASENRLRRKRKLYSEGGIISGADKRGRTSASDCEEKNARKDNSVLLDESDGDNTPVIEDDASKHSSNRSLEKSPATKLAVIPDVIIQAEGDKSTPKGGRKRNSVGNATCPSPGWSRLRSAHKDFEIKKKSAALPTLNVSGGDPCSSSSTKQHSARKSTESAEDEFPMSIPCIDDDESSIAPDLKKQKVNTSSITKKFNNKGIKKKAGPSATAPVVGHNSSISSTVAQSVTPLKMVGSRLSCPKQTTGSPSSKPSCVFLQTSEKTLKETSPLKESAPGMPTSCMSPKNAAILETPQLVESSPAKSHPGIGVENVVEQGKATPVSFNKGSKLAVPEQVPLSLKSQSSPTSKLPSTPVKVTSVGNVSEVGGLEECPVPVNKITPSKMREESQIIISPSVEKVKGYLEVSFEDRENEVESSFSTHRRTSNRLSITGLNHNTSVRSPRKSQKTTIPVLSERKTFSLETSTEDLSDLAHLRESTEDQLKGFKTSDAVEPPAIVHDCLRNRSFDQENKVNTGVAVNKSINRLSMDVGRENCSKHISPASVEESGKKNSIHKKPKLCVPVIKMGPLTKKGPNSRRRVKFYVLGNMRRCYGAIKTSEVGVATGPCSLQIKLPEVPKEALGKCVDVGVQTIFSPEKSESVPLMEKGNEEVESDNFDRSFLVSPLPNTIDENYNSVEKIQGREAGLIGEVKGTQFVCSRDGSVSPIFSMTHVDMNKGFSGFEKSGRKLMPQESARIVDQDIPYSVADCSLELIPDTELSGLKVKGVQSSIHQRSHRKGKPLRRNWSAKSAVCQLFSNNGSEPSQGEMALPLACTQISKPPEDPKAEVSESKEKELVVSLSSDSTSDHEGEEIAKNLRKMRGTKAHRKGKLDGGSQNRKFSPIREESIPKDFGEDSIAHYGEDLDSEEMDKKLKLIMANIDADMNIRKGKNKSDDDNVVSLKDDSEKDIMEVPIGSEPICPSVAPETNSIPLTCVAESESEHEEEGNNDEEKKNETKLEEDILKDDEVPLAKDCSGEESDFFIEGSQKEVETVEKPVVVKKPPMSLVTSGLPMSDVMQVKRMVQMFNLQFSPKFCAEGNSFNAPRTTHVVTKTDEAGKTGCTFKYLCGVVTGCWIVSIQWVNDCLKVGKLLDEAPYEALDDSGHSGPFMARNSTTKLFKDLQFYCQEPILDTIGQMEEIIELGGGKVVASLEEFSGKKGQQLVVVDASANENQEFFSRMCQRGIAVVTSEWIVESIGQYKLQPLVGYVVNLNSNLTSYSQHREALLAMGYNEDILGTEEDQMAFMRDDDDDDEDIESCTEDAI
ncbi:uncharacterized protein LOC124153979 [Ischnura elegans]|uniref:uncharacterized protein LOC124153979 n=1 Tax=Ischnura elegans TaxID=197161 RepID=UPI001ED8BA90|nr:uncharacterized protein LOC124153979 [Ischnura elegans]